MVDISSGYWHLLEMFKFLVDPRDDPKFLVGMWSQYAGLGRIKTLKMTQTHQDQCRLILQRRWPNKHECKTLNKIWGYYEKRPHLCMCEEEARREFVTEFRARWATEIRLDNE